jgi:hypothetical protein
VVTSSPVTAAASMRKVVAKRYSRVGSAIR